MLPHRLQSPVQSRLSASLRQGQEVRQALGQMHQGALPAGSDMCAYQSVLDGPLWGRVPLCGA